MTSPNRRLSLEEVLDELFLEAEEPKQDLVLRACEAHPEFRSDILEFAALWAANNAANEQAEAVSPADISDEDVSLLQSFVLNQLHEIDQPAALNDSGGIEAATKALKAVAGAALRRATTAIGLGESTVLLQKVVTNAIANIPRRVLAALAGHLSVADASLRVAIGGRRLAGGRSYSASAKPTVPKQESWESAVRSLPVSKEEQDRLLALQDEE